MRLSSLLALGLLGVLSTPTETGAAEPPGALPEETPAVRVVEPRRSAETETGPRAVEPKAKEDGPRAIEPQAAEPTAAPAEGAPLLEKAAPEDDAAAAAEENNALPSSTAPPGKPAASLPPFFRFGVAGLAGTTGFDRGAARLGLDAHFGAQLTPSFALFGGFVVGLTVEQQTPRTQQIFYGQFEGDYDDFLYVSAGPAGGLVPRSSTNLEDFSFAAGFLARAGVLVGRRNEEGRKNAFLVGLAFVGLLSDEFYSFPMVTLGYERF